MKTLNRKAILLALLQEYLRQDKYWTENYIAANTIIQIIGDDDGKEENEIEIE